jgi:hypothetical protein
MSKSSDWLPNGREGPLGAAGECAYSVTKVLPAYADDINKFDGGKDRGSFKCGG